MIHYVTEFCVGYNRHVFSDKFQLCGIFWWIFPLTLTLVSNFRDFFTYKWQIDYFETSNLKGFTISEIIAFSLGYLSVVVKAFIFDNSFFSKLALEIVRLNYDICSSVLPMNDDDL